MRHRRRGAAPCALAWLALSPSFAAAAAVSTADVLSHLGGKATGQTLTTAAYTLTMLANEDEVLVSISIDKGMGDVGWLGWGLGTAMAQADIVVLWPNSDSSWTLSHRNAPSTVMPIAVDSPASSDPSTDASGSLKVIGDLSSSTSSDSPTVVTFSRPLTMPSDYKTNAETKDLAKELNQPVIFALGTKNPGDPSPSADIEQHALTSMGSTFLDLSAEFDPAVAAVEAPLYALEESAAGGGTATKDGSSSSATSKATKTGAVAGATGTVTDDDKGAATTTGTKGAGSGATPTSKGPTGLSPKPTSTSATSPSSTSASSASYAQVILWHAYAAVFAWGIMAPLGVLIARLGRSCGFFPWHRAVQLATLSATIGAVGLAYYATTLKTASTTAVRDTHVYLGFGILVLVFIQCLLGQFAHLGFLARSPAARARGREMKSWAHIILGIMLILAGFFQIKLGMTKYGVTDNTLIYGYWSVVGGFSALYFASAAIAIAHPAAPPPRRRREHHRRSRKHEHHRPREEHHHHKHKSKKHEHHHKKPERRKRGRGHRREEEKELISSSAESGSSSGSGSDTETTASDSSSDHKRRRRRRRRRN